MRGNRPREKEGGLTKDLGPQIILQLILNTQRQAFNQPSNSSSRREFCTMPQFIVLLLGTQRWQALVTGLPGLFSALSRLCFCMGVSLAHVSACE